MRKILIVPIIALLSLMGLTFAAGAGAAPLVLFPTITGTCVAPPGATSQVCTFTTNGTTGTTVYVIYDQGHIAGPEIAYPSGHAMVDGVLSFTMTLPCTETGQAAADTIFYNPLFPEGNGYHFIDVTGVATLPGSCPPPTTTTTVPPTTTTTTTVAPTPTTVPQAPPGSSTQTPATPDGPKPLAFTGSEAGRDAVIGALALALGSLLVWADTRKNRRVVR